MSLGYKYTIPKNHSNQGLGQMIVFDVESDVVKQENGYSIFKPFLWTAVYHRFREGNTKNQTIYKHGSDIKEFWDFVVSRIRHKSHLILTSHHLEVDFVPLQGVPQLIKRGYILDKYISRGRTLWLTFHNGNKKLSVINTGNIFFGSVADWGEALGIQKLEMPSSKNNKKQWLEYCMRDTEVVLRMWQAFNEFVNEHNLGNVSFTAASQAFNAYRHRFMSIPISIHDYKPVVELERQAYHGGRFQALVVGRPKSKYFYQLDINSMYGAIMSEEKLPYQLVGYKENGGMKLLKYVLKNHAVIAECVIVSPEPFFPIKVDNKVEFPRGKYKVVLCTPEIEYCLKNGYISKVNSVAWYKQDKILKDYIQFFLKLRKQYKKEHNKPFELLSKLMINSLYGKFGQYNYNETIVGNCEKEIVDTVVSYDIDTNKKTTYYRYGGKVRLVKEEGNSRYAFVAIAAHITAYGRMRLWELMKQAQLKHVYHVATDSLVVDEQGYKNLRSFIDNDKIGYLKVENRIKELIIKDVNDVCYDGLEKIKGISKKAVKKGEDTYQVIYWSRFDALLKKKNFTDYKIREVSKTLSRKRWKKTLKNGVSKTLDKAYPDLM